MLLNPKVSFIIPILNSGYLLKDCLRSIAKQNYPKKRIEIICPDGGSRDFGPKIAEGFGARVISNKKILAEPGFMLGAEKASGELVVYMGADNRLYGVNWIRNMVEPFKDNAIIASYPWLRSSPKNTWLTKYFNAFTDPVNHFILGSSCNPLYFGRTYPIIKETKEYAVYDFTIDRFPMLAFDQGFMVRRSHKRTKSTEYDDILPVLDMVRKKKKMAFVFNASNYHYTLEKGLSQFARKMRWIIDNNIMSNPSFGFPTRSKYLNKWRKLRFYLWPVYATSIIGPLTISLIGLIRDRKVEWVYHFPITLIMVSLVAYEVFRVRVLRFESLASRQ